MLILIVAFLFFINSLTVAQMSDNIESADKVVLDSLIKNRNDKLLLINIWATWCIPCREEFPDLVKIAGKYSGKLDVVAISVDFADEIESKVKPFFEKAKCKLPGIY